MSDVVKGPGFGTARRGRHEEQGQGPPDPEPAAPELGTRASLAEAERAHIRAVLDACGGRISGRGNAADRLGLKRSTLQFRMKKLGITRPSRGA